MLALVLIPLHFRDILRHQSLTFALITGYVRLG